MAKTVLCYGDSNTWGYNPRSGERYGPDVRWPRVLGALLEGRAAGMYWVVEEGLNGRTACQEDPVEGDVNGLRQLPPIIKSHKPVELFIFMLGTNDLKRRFNPSPYDVSRGAQRVAKAAMTSEAGPGGGAPKVLMVCPPPMGAAPTFNQILAPDSVEISLKLAPYYRVCAKECGAEFFDAGSVAASSAVDGVHWDEETHRAFAAAMAEEVARII